MISRKKTTDENNHLSKMFLMSHGTYEKLNDQLKEMSRVRLLNRKMEDILKNKQQQKHDKWLNYSNLLSKRKQLEPGNDDDEIFLFDLRNDKFLELINRSMDKVLHNVKSNDNWLKYRQLLLNKGAQKRTSANKSTKKSEYKLRLQTERAMKNGLTKILSDRKLNNRNKWLQYRHLLYKHGLHKLADTDFDLYNAIWSAKTKRNKGLQTDANDIEKVLADFKSAKTADVGTQSDDAGMQPAEIVYSVKTPEPSPVKNVDEERLQKKYVSARKAAINTLLRRDLKNDYLDLTADDTDVSDVFHDFDESVDSSYKTPAFTKAFTGLKGAIAGLNNSSPGRYVRIAQPDFTPTASKRSHDDELVQQPGKLVRLMQPENTDISPTVSKQNNDDVLVQRKRKKPRSIRDTDVSKPQKKTHLKRLDRSAKRINTMDAFYKKIKAPPSSGARPYGDIMEWERY